jgi:hypothetical protein
MEYDINKISALCEKYFDGATSTEEEQLLRDYFTNAGDIPETLRSMMVMMCGLSEAAALTYEPVTCTVKRSKVHRIIWSSIGIAASIALCIAVFNRETYGYSIDGKAITDPEKALEGTVYLSYLSQLETTIDIAQAITEGMENNN